jgi:hypothetical protein
LQTKSVGGCSDPVRGVMRRFLKIVRDSFEAETNALHRKANPDPKGRLNPSANSIQLASNELAYAYLVRRALVLGGFDCLFEFEKQYPGSDEKADLVIHIPQRNRESCRAVVEIKWANSKKGWDCIEKDALKVLRADYDRKFLLVFPMRVWPEDRESPTDCMPIREDILSRLNQCLGAEPEKGSVRMMCEEEFNTWSEGGDEIKFGLTVFAVKTASKHLAVGVGS